MGLSSTLVCMCSESRYTSEPYLNASKSVDMNTTLVLDIYIFPEYIYRIKYMYIHIAIKSHCFIYVVWHLAKAQEIKTSVILLVLSNTH